jgi:hypothetical protein
MLIVVLASGASAQDHSIAGHWIGTMTRGDRSGTARLDLNNSNGKIAGTLSDPSGLVMKIENFRLEGSRFTFDAWGKQHGQPEKLHVVGALENGEIKLHRDYNGEKSGPTIVLHREGP